MLNVHGYMKFKNFIHSIPEERRKAIAKWTNRVLLAGVFTYLIFQLTTLDWREALREIPTNPLFYLIFVGIYFGLPVAESLIYRILWKAPFKKIFPELLKKRVYNKDVLNYSGEAHLYAWARKNIDRTDKQLLLDMKDNTIISSLTSMTLAFSLLTLFLFTGFLPFDALFEGVNQNWIIGGVLCAILLVLLALRFRRSVISISGPTAAALFGIHVSRLLIVMGLQILQWMVGMPETALEIWFVYLSLQIVANQIPLIPSKDVLVLAVSKDLSQQLQVSEAAIVSMFGINVLLDKLVNVILFTYLSSRKKPTNEQPSSDSWNKENTLIKNPSEP